MNDPKINFQAKPLSEFKPGESLCGQKIIRGYTYTFQGEKSPARVIKKC